ncbi:serine/threonine-protein phosphatase 4 regulatory subunit 2-B-like [Pyrus ussuriensis x Pyrus communis]|uniref:Serine/threonine-protein phosphatase 4 regulatory subunit 2-B-like n=1 Tax=Pyrus ussuriensis x Pyrus communis TaxID=2448454 RepID=A0A5N5F740_9ROSA|nr:serine/threonine-protein phosphatase 4 regulatory subunit 2-B-like [Pyrus ussuriensis x Pyrus communis]
MEMPSNENSQPSMNSTSDADHQQEAMLSDGVDNLGKESKLEVSETEVRGVLQVIASTGKFWHDWDKLKSMLSFQLKQVLLDYPEEEMASEQQIASLGETYPELVKRLDEALHSFTEGPPFTLQRLCEILLDAKRIYPNPSKLALALEKNLLVTSMLTASTDPYPQSTVQNSVEPDKAIEEAKIHSDSVAQNGVEPMVSGDMDEVMSEVEQADIDNDMTIAMEAFEDIVGSSDANSVQTNDS